MSLAYQNLVLEHSKTKGPGRLLLMILAHHCNNKSDDGICWIKQETLAAEMNVALPSLKRIVAQLKDSGEILVSEGRGRSNVSHFIITINRSPEDIQNVIEKYELKGTDIDTFLGVKGINSDTLSPEKGVKTDTISALKGINSVKKGINSDTQNLKELKNTTKFSDENLGDQAAAAPPSANFSEILTLSIKAIKAKKLDLTTDDWQKLIDLETQGKKRQSLLEFFETRVNAPPPAVEIVRELRDRYPPKTLWDEMAETVGGEPDDLARWRQVLIDYEAVGWNRFNYANQLEFYRKKESPRDAYRQGLADSTERDTTRAAQGNGHYENQTERGRPGSGNIIPIAAADVANRAVISRLYGQKR